MGGFSTPVPEGEEADSVYDWKARCKRDLVIRATAKFGPTNYKLPPMKKVFFDEKRQLMFPYGTGADLSGEYWRAGESYGNAIQHFSVIMGTHKEKLLSWLESSSDSTLQGLIFVRFRKNLEEG